MDAKLLEQITAWRAELDELEERLAKQLAEVRAERDALAVAERVLEGVSEQLAGESASAASVSGQVGGRAVMLIPHRTPDMEETTLPPDYQRNLAVVRQAAGPVMARAGRRRVPTPGPMWTSAGQGNGHAWRRSGARPVPGPGVRASGPGSACRSSPAFTALRCRRWGRPPPQAPG
ncbi:coiled-coil domain-containing protein [Streptomyces pactum]|uniref:coiled-coil domain-containing protein n=1 Tax=Streptomyces pactum TaxID=68249 RepID=UPI001E39D7AF|nr:hypothetical protein [Streptomyces pactum]